MACPLCRRDYMILDGVLQPFDTDRFGTIAYASVERKHMIYGIVYSDTVDGNSKFYWSLQLTEGTNDIEKLCFYTANGEGACESKNCVTIFEDGAYLDNYWEALNFACPGVRLGFDQFFRILYN